MTDEEWIKLRKKEKRWKIVLSLVLAVFFFSLFVDISHMFQFFVVIFLFSIVVSIYEGITLLRKKMK